MAKFTIELEDGFTVNRAGVEVAVPVADLPKEMIVALVQHGLTQKIGDAAAGAVATTFNAMNDGKDWGDQSAKAKAAFKAENGDAIRETAEADMKAVVAQLLENNWGATRGAGGGLSDVDREMISIIRPQVKASDDAAYKNASPADRDAMCKAYIAKLEDAQAATLRKHAETRVRLRKEQAAALAALDQELEL